MDPKYRRVGLLSKDHFAQLLHITVPAKTPKFTAKQERKHKAINLLYNAPGFAPKYGLCGGDKNLLGGIALEGF